MERITPVQIALGKEAHDTLEVLRKRTGKNNGTIMNIILEKRNRLQLLAMVGEV